MVRSKNPRIRILIAALLLALLLSTTFIAQDSKLTQPQEKEVLAKTDAVLEELRTMRGLPPPKPIHKEFRSRDQLREMLARYSREEKNQLTLEAERKTLLKFGLIPKDFPYVKFILDLLTEQIAGFYDFRTHELNLLDTAPMDLQIPILAHELTHALQDQSFDLKKFNIPAPNNDDLTEAHETLVEGDATAMMLDFLLKPMGRSINTLGFDVREMLEESTQMTASSQKTFNEAPRALQTTLKAPYLYGTTFFQYFRRHNDWPKLPAVYRDPPVSMEQMMHPQKYFEQRDNPVYLSIPSPKSEFQRHWKLVDTNVLGELGMLIVLQQHLNDDNARIASEGWGGDQYQIYEDDSGRLLLLLFSTWDTPEDAVQFFNSYRVLLEQKYKNLKVVQAEEHTRFRWNAEKEQIGLEIRDHDVVVIEGASAADYETLRELLWQSKKQSKVPTPMANSK